MKKIILIILSMILLVSMIPLVFAVECRDIGNTTGGTTGGTIAFGHKGGYKFTDDQLGGRGVSIHASSNTVATNYSASMVSIASAFGFGDVGTLDFAGNDTFLWHVEADNNIIRERMIDSSGTATGVSITETTLCGDSSCGPSIAMTPNSSHLWAVDTGGADKGTVSRYDTNSGVTTNPLWDSGVTNPDEDVSIFVDAEIVYVSNQTHIRQLDHGGNLICDYEHHFTPTSGTVESKMWGNSTNLIVTITGGGGTGTWAMLDLNITAAPADQCDCPGSGDFEINDGSDCELSTTCDIGSNKFRLSDGKMRIVGSGVIRAGGCFIADAQNMFVEDSAGLSCGRASIELELLPIRANNNLTTESTNPKQVDFTAFINNNLSVVFTSNDSSTAGAGNVFWSHAYLNLAANSFQVKTESDTGSNKAGKLNWLAVRAGDYDLGTGRLQCGTTPAIGTGPSTATASFNTPFADTNYSIVCAPADDVDTPACNPSIGGRSVGSAEMEIRDDNGAEEDVSGANWCALTFGNHSVDGVKIKAGSGPISTGTFDIGFGTEDQMPSADYVVIISAQGNDFQCDVETRTISGFTGSCYEDAGALGGIELDWITIERVDRDLSLG